MHPVYSDVLVSEEWRLLPTKMSIYHDNGIGKEELKYINIDGREAVFDGDTLGIMRDAKYKATYNYVSPAKEPKGVTDIKGIVDYGVKGLGHILMDMMPYYLTGSKNDRNQ